MVKYKILTLDVREHQACIFRCTPSTPQKASLKDRSLQGSEKFTRFSHLFLERKSSSVQNARRIGNSYALYFIYLLNEISSLYSRVGTYQCHKKEKKKKEKAQFNKSRRGEVEFGDTFSRE